jgi:hypothetical protein
MAGSAYSGRLEWQKAIKRHPEQKIKILENFDKSRLQIKLSVRMMAKENKMVQSST